MRRALTIVLAFYWMSEFAILAVSCVAKFDDGLQAALAMLGAERLPAVCADGGLVGAAMFGGAFSLVSLLFAWTLITCFSQEAKAHVDEVAKLGFVAAILSMAAVGLAGSVLDVAGVFPVAAVELLALLASYLATQAERPSSEARALGGQEVRNLPRTMAVNAAVQYSPPRIRPHSKHWSR